MKTDLLTIINDTTELTAAIGSEVRQNAKEFTILNNPK